MQDVGSNAKLAAALLLFGLAAMFVAQIAYNYGWQGALQSQMEQKRGAEQFYFEQTGKPMPYPKGYQADLSN